MLLQGRELRVQGYEDFGIRYLLEHGYDPELIQNTSTGKMPSFKWRAGKGRHRFYFPDFWIQGTNEIWEVKSTYTLGLGCRGVYRTVQRKAKACIEAGYKFNLLVIMPKRVKKGIDRSRRGYRYYTTPNLLSYSYEDMMKRLNYS